MLDELAHTSRPCRPRADTEALRRRAEGLALRERSGPPAVAGARSPRLPSGGFGAAPAGYEPLTSGPRPRLVRMRTERPSPSALDAAGMWIRALALRLMFTLTGRV